ncbi:pseudouridine synthase [Zhongshania guokunii]|uniref:Pseudouridine synthase n=1 Tax=Zhongshania guokunii TaxID=641783 RepID=A0ABV3U490_9GAMM
MPSNAVILIGLPLSSYKSRLDRFISRQTGIKRGDVRALLAQGRVRVNGQVAADIAQLITQFSQVWLDDCALQAQTPVYLMLNKPSGVVSATKDKEHTTVIDLLARNDRGQLHIPGRLDFNSTGLLLLTNDGHWSRQLSLPERNIEKVYTVTVAKPLTDDYVAAFAEGMYFEYENVTTLPAQLRIVSDYVAEVSLREGRYHQVKRMFGRFQNEVLALHRHRIGSLELDLSLAPGESRDLALSELAALAASELGF